MRPDRSLPYPLLLLLLLLVAARALFIACMPATYSYDLYAWLDVIEALKQHRNPYELGTLNWPPFWMQVLYGVSRLHDLTGIASIRLIQSLLIAGECATLCISYRAIRRFSGAEPFRILLFGLVLNPVCILLSCQHGNFDVFTGLWILLFTCSLLSYHRDKAAVSWLLAAFFLGIGIFTKTVPFILTPVLFAGLDLPDRRTRAFGLALVVIPVLIGMGTLYPLAPGAVAKYVLGYRSMAGWFGITGILQLGGANAVAKAWVGIAPWLLLLLMLWAWLRFRQRRLTARAYLLLPLVLLVFLIAFGPGYSPPYLLWFLPLVLLLLAGLPRPRPWWFGIAGIVCLLTYLVEYACFESHGAWLTTIAPGFFTVADSKVAGSLPVQVVIRLPLFACYLALWVWLLRRLRLESDPVSDKI